MNSTGRNDIINGEVLRVQEGIDGICRLVFGGGKKDGTR